MIPAAEWKPDLGPLAPDSTDYVMNVIPIGGGWKSFPDVSVSANALPAACVGGCYYRTSTGSFGVIAGTTTNLYRMDTTTSPYSWVSIGSGFAVPAGHYWQFEKFGAKLYAVSLGADMQVFDTDAGGNFTLAPGSPPRAKFITTVGDFLVLGYLKVGGTEFPNKWTNSGINNPAQWTVGNELCDDQVLPDGDEITGLKGGPGGGRVFQRKARRRLLLSSDVSMPIKQTDIDKAHGVVAPYATIQLPGDSYVSLEDDGFFVGDERRAVSVERVSRTFFATCSNLEGVQGIADPVCHMAWWRYLDNDGKPRMIGWDWDTDRWAQADPDVEFLMSAVSTALTLEALTPLFLALYGSSSIDTPGIESLDSPRWKGGRPMLSAFTSDHKLAPFTGPPRAPTVATTATLLSGMKRSKVTGCYPLSDSTGWQVAMAIGNRIGDVTTMSIGPFGAQNRLGRCPVRGNGKLVRFVAAAPAGLPWDHFHGIEPVLHEGGSG